MPPLSPPGPIRNGSDGESVVTPSRPPLQTLGTPPSSAAARMTLRTSVQARGIHERPYKLHIKVCILKNFGHIFIIFSNLYVIKNSTELILKFRVFFHQVVSIIRV